MSFVSPYRLTKLMAKDKRRQIWLAQSPLTLEPVVVKMVESHDEKDLSHLKNEWKIGQTVHHPAFLQYKALVFTDLSAGSSWGFLRKKKKGYYALVMEYAPGYTLNRFIPKKGGLSFSQALPYFQLVLEGIEALHALGIVHLDIKAANLLFDPTQGSLKILDLGLAVELSQFSPRLNGERTGTPGYIAPELIAHHSPHPDYCCDVYSLGVLLYFMLTGRRPFKGNSSEEIIEKQLQGFLDFQHEHLNVPSLVSILAKAMAVEPQKRYRTVKELREALCLIPTLS